MERASKPELAQRINQAFSLMEKGLHSDQIIQHLQQEFGVSQIQAYRYLQRAKKNTSLQPIPEPTQLYTTKLAYSLIQRLRTYSKNKGIPINQVISHALVEYLKRQKNGQEKE